MCAQTSYHVRKCGDCVTNKSRTLTSTGLLLSHSPVVSDHPMIHSVTAAPKVNDGS